MLATAGQQDAGSLVLGLGLLAVAVFIYFIPVIAARLNHHHNTIPIGILNLFLGWTLIGWVIALVWAFMAPAPRRAEQ